MLTIEATVDLQIMEMKKTLSAKERVMSDTNKRFALIEGRLGVANTIAKMGTKSATKSKSKEDTIRYFEMKLEALQKERVGLEKDLEARKVVRFRGRLESGLYVSTGYLNC